MKIRVIHDFYDKENDLELRKVGEEQEVTEERGRYLVDFRVAKEITDLEGGDPESPVEAQGETPYFYVRRLKTTRRHRVINCPCETHVKLYSCRQHIKNCKGA